MINIQNYYLKFHNENKSTYEENILYKTLYNKIEKLRQYEKESFYEKNGKENDINKIKEFITQIKNFILENNKEYNSSINQSFILYYQSIRNFYAMKGEFFARKYNLNEEEQFFKLYSQTREKQLNSLINKEKKELSQTLVSNNNNILYNYLKINYEQFTFSSFIKTISTIGIITIGLFGIRYVIKNKQN